MQIPCTPPPHAGFTLIELMIATSVSGVLSSIAYPSFSGALQKVRRTDALVAMMQVQQAQERWRANNSRYGTLANRRARPSPAATTRSASARRRPRLRRGRPRHRRAGRDRPAAT